MGSIGDICYSLSFTPRSPLIYLPAAGKTPVVASLVVCHLVTSLQLPGGRLDSEQQLSSHLLLLDCSANLASERGPHDEAEANSATLQSQGSHQELADSLAEGVQVRDCLLFG